MRRIGGTASFLALIGLFVFTAMNKSPAPTAAEEAASTVQVYAEIFSSWDETISMSLFIGWILTWLYHGTGLAMLGKPQKWAGGLSLAFLALSLIFMGISQPLPDPSAAREITSSWMATVFFTAMGTAVLVVLMDLFLPDGLQSRPKRPGKSTCGYTP